MLLRCFSVRIQRVKKFRNTTERSTPLSVNNSYNYPVRILFLSFLKTMYSLIGKISLIVRLYGISLRCNDYLYKFYDIQLKMYIFFFYIYIDRKKKKICVKQKSHTLWRIKEIWTAVFSFILRLFFEWNLFWMLSYILYYTSEILLIKHNKSMFHKFMLVSKENYIWRLTRILRNT